MKHIIAVSLLAGIILTACEKSETSETSKKSENTESRECISNYKEMPVDAANVPATGQAGIDIPIEVFFRFPNSCFKFDSFKEEITGNLYTIRNIGYYKVCEICSQGFINAKRTYHFKAASPGLYTLTFWQGGNNYFADTIIIQ